MWITALPQIRRTRFEIFYYMHHLYIVFLVFFLFHAGDRHFYMIFPGVFLFGLDKLLRILQSRPQTYILSARLYPCKAVELILPKDTGTYILSHFFFLKLILNIERKKIYIYYVVHFRIEIYPNEHNIHEDTEYI